MAGMAGESGDNHLLDVVDENKDLIDDFSEEFYDACNVDSLHKSKKNVPDDAEDDEFHDPDPIIDDGEMLNVRIEEESSLTDEELEVNICIILSRSNVNSKRLDLKKREILNSEKTYSKNPETYTQKH